MNLSDVAREPFVELSETNRGRAWLANFETDEQPYARMLLDGLDLVGQDRLRTGLRDRLRMG